MEKRYKLMATCGARNIATYNRRVAAARFADRPGGAGRRAGAPAEQLSYVVLVIDELADLMLTVPAEIEADRPPGPMARAVGIIWFSPPSVRRWTSSPE